MICSGSVDQGAFLGWLFKTVENDPFTIHLKINPNIALTPSPLSFDSKTYNRGLYEKVHIRRTPLVIFCTAHCTSRPAGRLVLWSIVALDLTPPSVAFLLFRLVSSAIFPESRKIRVLKICTVGEGKKCFQRCCWKGMFLTHSIQFFTATTKLSHSRETAR
jgi:hypothetical protein